jgi:hypothetical protein
MRTSSFSNEQVIEVLSRYFVPVWLSVDDCGTQKSDADLAEWRQIQKNGKAGNVFVYIVAPDCSVIDKLGVAQALKPDEYLLPLLRKVVKEQALKPRDPKAVRATATPADAIPGPKSDGGVMLRLWAHGERGRVEDWLELSVSGAAAFAPAANVAPGSSWAIDGPTAEHLYKHFYPPVGNYRAENSKIISSSLTVKVATVTASEVRMVLEGDLEMQHNASFDNSMPAQVKMRVIGVARYDRTRRQLTALQLTTEGGQHTWYWQGKPARTAMDITVELVKAPAP